MENENHRALFSFKENEMNYTVISDPIIKKIKACDGKYTAIVKHLQSLCTGGVLKVISTTKWA